MSKLLYVSFIFNIKDCLSEISSTEYFEIINASSKSSTPSPVTSPGSLFTTFIFPLIETKSNGSALESVNLSMNSILSFLTSYLLEMMILYSSPSLASLGVLNTNLANVFDNLLGNTIK